MRKGTLDLIGRARTRMAAAIRQFRRDERGTVIVFMLMMFMLMVMMGGLAVDLMRYEQRRTALQQTSDRATLAAASITNDILPDVVANSYFVASDMEGYLENVSVIQSYNSKEVKVEASVPTEPIFLHLMGIDQLDAPAASSAEQRINNVEIQLVLDVSGSMGGQKLTNLKSAARDFVDTVLANDTEQRISIGIVPYNAQVNLGSVLRSKYNAAYAPVPALPNINCLEVPNSAYSSVTLSRTLPMPMSAYADVTSSSKQDTSYINRTDTNQAVMASNASWCKPNAENTVMLPSNDGVALKAKISGLTAGGNTSIMAGMKWGLTLIEPGARPMFDELIGSGHIPGIFSGRPFSWDDENALKVIVLMTDGEHVAHDKVNDNYKVALSPIYRSNGDGNYSIHHPARAGVNKYWTPHDSTWRSGPYTNNGEYTQLNWNQVWGQQRLTWVAWQMYARALGTTNSTRTTQYNAAMNLFRSQFASVASMNTQLQTSCNIARENEILVFGIAFEAPAAGQTAIQNCSPDRYYNASGLNISAVFQSIASQISLLRLTQ